MKEYFPFFRNYRKALILAPTLVIIDVFCEIVQPKLMSKIVDLGVSQKNMSYVLHTGGIMVALSILAIAANVGNIYYSSHASVGFAAEYLCYWLTCCNLAKQADDIGSSENSQSNPV